MLAPLIWRYLVSQNIFRFFGDHGLPWVTETADTESVDMGAHLYLLLWQVLFCDKIHTFSLFKDSN
jgi:hypothetical protein